MTTHKQRQLEAARKAEIRKKAISKIINQAKVDFDVPQYEIAKMIGVTENVLCNWKDDPSVIKSRYLWRICDNLNPREDHLMALIFGIG